MQFKNWQKVFCLFTACSGISYFGLSSNVSLIVSEVFAKASNIASKASKQTSSPNDKPLTEQEIKQEVCSNEGNIRGVGKGFLAMRGTLSYTSKICN